MKKSLISILALLISLSLYGCDDYTPVQESYDDEDIITEQTTVSEVPDVTEAIFENVTLAPDKDDVAPIVVTEKIIDYYSAVAEVFKPQISIISDKAGELAGEHEYMLVTDLDGNGRAELILYKPDMVIYEISENRDSLVKTAEITENVPELTFSTERLMLIDADGKRHYVWNSYSDEPGNMIRESENNYLYENGKLSRSTIRYRKYDLFAGEYTVFGSESGDCDFAAYSGILADVCFNRGYTVEKNIIGMIDAADFLEAEDTERRQLTAQSFSYFSVAAPGLRYNYSDLDGTWVRTGGFYSEDSIVPGTDINYFNLVFHDNLYEIILKDSVKGEMKKESRPVSFRFDSSFETELWCASLADCDILKNAVVRISADGKLNMKAQIADSTGQLMPVEWSFEKNGWSYQEVPSDIPVSSPAVSENVPENISPEAELTEKALSYYQRRTSYRPGHAEVKPSGEEWIYSVRLYDDFEDHTATSAWYDIDIRYMTGTDLMTGEVVDLNS